MENSDSTFFKPFIIKKHLVLHVIVIMTLWFNFQGKAQISCNTGQFYAVGNSQAGMGATIYSLMLSGNTISLGSAVTNLAPISLFGIAIANLDGTGDSFYSTSSSHSLKQYSGGAWQTIFTANHNIIDGAGKNEYLYFHNLYTPNFGSQWINQIDRYSAGTLTNLWTDTTMFTAVADMAVDNSGNVFFFTGAVQFTVDTLRVMSPAGVFLSAIPVSFDPSNAYGIFLMDSTLYVGLGSTNLTFPNTLLPITLSNGSAVVGTPIPMPHPQIGTSTNGAPIYLEFSDLASCNDGGITTSRPEYESNSGISVFPNPATDICNVIIREPKKQAGMITITDILGNVVRNILVQSSPVSVDVGNLATGPYFVHYKENGQIMGTRKLMIQRLH